jgi:hypothetical protein
MRVPAKVFHYEPAAYVWSVWAPEVLNACDTVAVSQSDAASRSPPPFRQVLAVIVGNGLELPETAPAKIDRAPTLRLGPANPHIPD